MVYYSSLHDSITSLCKTLLPFSSKKRRQAAAITAAEAEIQSDNLKWQQDSYHQILNLMGLCREGILPETELSVFRSHILDTLIASPLHHEQPQILRDKFIFLQELLYAKCISEEEYHSSKKTLLERLAVQGTETEARDLILGATPDEEWSVIDLKDDQCLLKKQSSISKKKSGMKQIKGAASVFSFGSLHKNGKIKEDKGGIDLGIGKKKPFRILFQKEKQWGFDGLKKWKRGDEEDDETAPLALSEGSDVSPSTFFIDKVLSEKIKKELLRIQTELNATNSNAQLSNDQIEAISTRLPVDKADLKMFFPKSWCDRYGDVVLDVVRKQFKDHVEEKKNLQNVAGENLNSKRWATFDDDENCHPNLLFVPPARSIPAKQPNFVPLEDDRVYSHSRNTDKRFKYNPFFDN